MAKHHKESLPRIFTPRNVLLPFYTTQTGSHSTCTTVWHEVIPYFVHQKWCWPFGYHLPAIYLQLWHISQQMPLLFSPGGLWSLFTAYLANPKCFLALPVHAGHNEFRPAINKSLLQKSIFILLGLCYNYANILLPL